MELITPAVGKHQKNNADHHYRGNEVGRKGNRLQRLFQPCAADLIKGERQDNRKRKAKQHAFQAEYNRVL